MSTGSSEFSAALNPAFALGNRDRQSLAQIAAVVASTWGHGCIYFGMCTNRLKIRRLEEELQALLAPKGIAPSPLILAERDESTDPPGFRVLVPDPISWLVENTCPGAKLFLIHGLSHLIRAQTAASPAGSAPVTQLLNYRRELFRDHGISALFWLDKETVPYLMQNSPDFWAFRSGTAEFSGAMDEDWGRIAQPEELHQPDSLPSSSADLDEMLRQLAFYRQKSPPDENAVGNLLLDIGRFHIQRRRLQEAFAALDEALEIFQRLNLSQRIRDARLLQSSACLYAGQLKGAQASLDEAIRIDQERGDERGLATEYNNLSQIYKSRGELDEAEKWLRKAIDIDGRLGNEPGLATEYNNLSPIYQARGELNEAEEWLREAIEISERLGDEPHLAISYNNLSQIYDARGELNEAEKWLRKAIDIDQRLGDEPHLAIRYNNLSQIYQARGELDEAEKWLRKAIALLEPKGPSANLATLKENLAALLRKRSKA